jgi:hypothetical protein
MDVRIEKEDFLEAFKQVDMKLNNLPSIEFHIKHFSDEIRKNETKLNDYYQKNHLPRLSFSIIKPTIENRDDESKAINYPHIRCVAVYDIEGKKNRLSIYIGRLEDFPEGKECKETVKIAREKAFLHLCKIFPHLFTRNQTANNTSMISIARFFELYKEVDNLNKKNSSYRQELERYTANSAKIHKEINEIKNNNYLPQINLTAIHPDMSVIKDAKHSLAFPHIRCMATYNIANTKKRINIYIGKLDEFPNGVNDLKAISIAREKTFIHLSKLFPQIFLTVSS